MQVVQGSDKTWTHIWTGLDSGLDWILDWSERLDISLSHSECLSDCIATSQLCFLLLGLLRRSQRSSSSGLEIPVLAGCWIHHCIIGA